MKTQYTILNDLMNEIHKIDSHATYDLVTKTNYFVVIDTRFSVI